jgi:hypothetical protein
MEVKTPTRIGRSGGDGVVVGAVPVGVKACTVVIENASSKVMRGRRLRKASLA